LSAESSGPFSARKSCSALFELKIASALVTSARQCAKARLYTERSLERHAFVSLIESRTATTSNTRDSASSKPMVGQVDAA